MSGIGISIGVDIGGTKIAFGALRGQELLGKTSVPTPKEGWESVLAAVVEGVQHVRAQYGDGPVGVGVPGPLNREHTEVKFAPNIYGFRNVPIHEYLSGRLGAVVIENDAKAAALAEATVGAARGTSSSVFITVSTGIGSGIVLNGRVWRGFNGIAGELGHIVALPQGAVAGSGVAGALEAVASGTAIARDATFALGRATTTAEAFALAQQGERRAEKVVHGAMRFIGMAVADVQKFLDPEVFVIGGGTAGVGEYFFRHVQEYADEYAEGFAQVNIRPAQLGSDAGVIGAALSALAG